MKSLAITVGEDKQRVGCMAAISDRLCSSSCRRAAPSATVAFRACFYRPVIPLNYEISYLLLPRDFN